MWKKLAASIGILANVLSAATAQAGLEWLASAVNSE